MTKRKTKVNGKHRPTPPPDNGGYMAPWGWVPALPYHRLRPLNGGLYLGGTLRPALIVPADTDVTVCPPGAAANPDTHGLPMAVYHYRTAGSGIADIQPEDLRRRNQAQRERNHRERQRSARFRDLTNPNPNQDPNRDQESPSD